MTVLAFNVVALVLLLVGWLAGWLAFSIERDKPESKWGILVQLNTDRVADDVQETAATLEAAADVDTVVGDVVRRVGDDRITVQPEKGQEITARINDATELAPRAGAPSPAAFETGDRVELVFREQDGRNEAVRIAHVERN
jgi:hypothetical protein